LGSRAARRSNLVLASKKNIFGFGPPKTKMRSRSFPPSRLPADSIAGTTYAAWYEVCAAGAGKAGNKAGYLTLKFRVFPGKNRNLTTVLVACVSCRALFDTPCVA
jgi:hypothetical protein